MWKSFAVALALTASPLSFAKGIGMVLDVQGAVTAEDSGKMNSLQITDPVTPNMHISVPSGSEISFVFYPTREIVGAAGPALLLVGQKVVTVERGDVPKFRKLPEDKTQVAQGYQGRVIPAAIIMKTPGRKTPPELIYPLDGEMVIGPNIEFVWNAVEPVEFRLIDGRQSVLQQTVEGKSLRLPADIPLVAGHRYRWEVREATAGAPIGSGQFSVATDARADEAARLKPASSAPPSDWVLYALALETMGAVSEARRAWSAVLKLRPESFTARELAE